uniref:Uncharacterized protein n=1 Tax=Astyanax mexicanus TaxID=7994 RepID=A0A3B1K4G0_ASTMX
MIQVICIFSGSQWDKLVTCEAECANEQKHCFPSPFIEILTMPIMSRTFPRILLMVTNKVVNALKIINNQL